MTDAFARVVRDTEALLDQVGEKTWERMRTAFPDQKLALWSECLQRFSARNNSLGSTANFSGASLAAAAAHGPDLALTAVQLASMLEGDSGAAKAYLAAVASVAPLIPENSGFRIWLRTIEELTVLAPESAQAVFERSAYLLTRVDPLAFRAWVLNGIRAGGSDANTRLAYFLDADAASIAELRRDEDSVTFSDVEKTAGAVLMALWKLSPAMRPAAVRPGAKAPRRSSFDGNIIRVPERYGGYRGANARAHYFAVMTHIGAHRAFTRARFAPGTLKPIQIILVGLIEDARVEALAAREYPGLQRLWSRFHIAEPRSGFTLDQLMMRLSRALIDPLYEDDDPWVNKGRMLFFESRSRWEDQTISRSIGNLLGNDIGQMRIQFNPKTNIVEPSYRDDNTGIWEFAEPPPEQAQQAETILESVRITERETQDSPTRRDRNDADPNAANMAAKLTELSEDEGIPIARHPEWDHISGIERREWTTLVDFRPRAGQASAIDDLLWKYRDVEARIARLVRSAKVSRPVRMKRRPYGEKLDIDACIAATIDRRAGLSTDPRLFETSEMRSRDLSVLLLLDISESTRDRIKDTNTTIIALERAAAALLGTAMSGLGDPFAIHAFCSNGREEVRYYRVKDFDEPYSAITRARLAGLRGMLSTRLGAALRQAGAEIRVRTTHRKLVLLVSDGEPSDVDVADKTYLVEDARKAVQSLSHQGIDVFCVGLDHAGEAYLPRIFGIRNFVTIDRIEALPEKLPMLYLRLTV
ncbi:hypothetical protein BH10PSE7_BH10PSE7_12460 [soil metagenome]